MKDARISPPIYELLEQLRQLASVTLMDWTTSLQELARLSDALGCIRDLGENYLVMSNCILMRHILLIVISTKLLAGCPDGIIDGVLKDGMLMRKDLDGKRVEDILVERRALRVLALTGDTCMEGHCV